MSSKSAKDRRKAAAKKTESKQVAPTEDSLKAKGDKAMNDAKYDEAIEFYTKALKEEAKADITFKVYSNRSGCHYLKKDVSLFFFLPTFPLFFLLRSYVL
jgi:hypothetical protein